MSADLGKLVADGVGLYQYCKSNPVRGGDPTGLYDLENGYQFEEGYEDATDIMGMLSPMPGPSTFITSTLSTLVQFYSDNMINDLEWALDWDAPDDAYSRRSDLWVTEALGTGLYSSFDVGIPFSDNVFNPLDSIAPALANSLMSTPGRAPTIEDFLPATPGRYAPAPGKVARGPYKALRLPGIKIAPGADFTDRQKQMIWAANWRKNGGQYICDRTGLPLKWSEVHIDHIIPKSKGGTNSFANAQFVHKRWNWSKGNRLKGRKRKHRRN
jgi:hypothetical protein